MDKTNIAFIAIVTISFLAFVTAARIDSVEANTLFYAKSLPLLYYVSIILSFSFVLISKKNILNLISSIIFGFLILYFPLILFVQFWFPDIYFYLYESLALVRDAHFGIAGHSAETPAISLLSGSYMLITGIDPVAYAKIYQGLVIIVIALLLFCIAVKFNLSNPSLAPLAFFSIVWQDELHFCRLSFSLIFYLMFLLLLIRKPEDFAHKMSLTNIIANLLIIPALVLSHPATPLFLILNLITAVILIKTFIKGVAPYIKEMLFKASIVCVTWIGWNLCLGNGGGAISTLLRFCTTIIESLSGGTQLQNAATKLSIATYKPTYYLLIQAHLVHWLLVFFIGLLILLVCRLYRNITGLTLIACFLSSQSTAVFFYLGGLAFFSRPSLFTYIAFAPIVAFALNIFLNSFSVKFAKMQMRKPKIVFNLFIIVFISFSALSMPLLKYSDIPFLYMPTQEHDALKFTLINLPSNRSLVSTSYNTPGGFYAVLLDAYGGQKGKIAYSDWRFLVGTQEIEETAVLILRSVVTRDAYFQTNPTYEEIIELLNNYLPITHSKIYDSGECVELFMPSEP